MQSQSDAFMPRSDYKAFGQVYKKAKDDYWNNVITLDMMKNIINNEFIKRVLQRHKGSMAIMALALLLGKDRNWIYGVLIRTEITQKIEAGEYFPF